MNRIKFSHVYTKFPYLKDYDCKGKLIQVLKVNYKDLSKEFITYDTRYLNEDKKATPPENKKFDYYELPKTDLLILIINTGTYIFTTIRRWTPEKERYYRSIVGNEIEIVIEKVE